MPTNMDYKDIINTGKLIYASRSIDQEFRRWRLNKTVCDVVLFKTFELTKLDKVVLLTLNHNNNKLYSNQLAKILGFNVQDNFDVEPKRYKDNGEVSIFNNILKELQSFGLIQFYDNQVITTHLGKLALKKGVKYVFYTAALPLNESFDIAQKSERDYLFFPYRKSLGIISKIQNPNKKPIEDFNVSNIEEILYGNPEELVARLRLQSETDINIFQASLSSNARMGDAFVDFRLYELEGKKYPLVFFNDDLAPEANKLLFKQCNSEYVASKVHIGEYLYLVRESKMELTFSTLSPFMDIWDLDDFIESQYLQWHDSQLFDSLAEKANGSQWASISTICPLEALKPQLKKYESSLDWIALSERFDDDFIIENALNYPWDIESLSANRSVDFIKRLIVIPGLHKDTIDWNWETIMPKLDEEFILEHIGTIPFVMFAVTDVFLTNYPNALYSYPNRDWDWKLVSERAELGYILEHISVLGEHIYLDDVMTRSFADDYWALRYCESTEFAFAVIENKERLVSRYNANSAQYKWTIPLVEWHQKMGFVTWKSSAFAAGLECNNNIVWSSNFFERFKNEEYSIRGFNHISECISDCSSIDSNPDFKWSWAILSRRDIVIQDIEFIKRHLNQLSIEEVLTLVSQNYVDQLYLYQPFKELASAKKVWSLITEKVSESTIRRNFLDTNWDWKILTKRFCSSMHIAQLGDARWVEKLDWDYLSENIDIELIQDNLDLYIDRWNWNCITNRVNHEFLISNLPEYYNNWNWEALLSTILTDEDIESLRIQIAIILSQLNTENLESLWAIFTRRNSTETIIDVQTNPALNSIDFKWNYKDVYNRPDFNIQSYLDIYLSSHIEVDWDALSSSKALNRILRWDKKITKDYDNWVKLALSILENKEFKWNFIYLSTLSSINGYDSILKVRTDEWDWDYLSEHSSYFSSNQKNPKALIKHIEKFAEYLNFSILSKRKDVKIDVETFGKHLDYAWDWNAISLNKSIELSADLVSNNQNLPWDWHSLSSRQDCEFSLDFIVKNQDYEWDWTSLSRNRKIQLNSDILLKLYNKDWDWPELLRRNDIKFSPELLRKLSDKDLKWFAYSQRNDFYPTMEILGILKDKDLDWAGISRREELAYNVILIYKDKLDWEILSHSSHIDITKPKVLETFKDYLDWNYISKSKNFSPKLELLEIFKNYVNWSIISKRRDFLIDAEILSKFEPLLDWSAISRSGVITFTQELIEKYKNRWDWVALSENPAFRASGIENNFKKELNLMEFYNELNEYSSGKPCIYHFTHMFNAIEVIRTRKILSRNRAKELGLLKYDAAGAVVHRSAKAHPYARFYYRTGTQTQFYNECLGKQRNNKYYQNALGNGLPMCPMPVFFKFDLQEVLTTCSSLCSYSTGNLQANWADLFKVTDNPHYIDAEHLYSYNNYDKIVRDKKQQEFLIKNEFDFSNIKNFQIICYDREETEILRSIFKDDPICEHIYSAYEAEDVFEHVNPQLIFDINSSDISVSTRYLGDFIFQIESNNVTKVNVLNPQDVKAVKKNTIQLYNEVSVELGETPFDLYYINMSPAARSPRWLIYQHAPIKRELIYTNSKDIEMYLGISFEDEEFSPEELIMAIEIAMPKLENLYNTRVRHYVVKDHILLVCKQFEKYAFDFNQKVVNLDLMRIIFALHDIGKAIDRSSQREHTISLVREFWEESPFTDYELHITETLLKDDHLGQYFQNKYDLALLKQEIISDADSLHIDAADLLQLKMVLYQCDIASYTKDAGGLKYLEHMFVYNDGEKVFNNDENLLSMSSEYWERYLQLKNTIQ